ncbi:hypothetical protein EV715DRAFT_291684 [Schizophyllum commune]
MTARGREISDFARLGRISYPSGAYPIPLTTYPPPPARAGVGSPASGAPIAQIESTTFEDVKADIRPTMKFTLFLALTAFAASPAVLAAPTNADAIHVTRSRISLMGQKVSPHPHKDTTIPGNDSSVDAQFAVCGRGFRNCGSKA